MAQVGSKLAPSWPMLGQAGDILELCRPMLAHLGGKKHCKKIMFFEDFLFWANFAHLGDILDDLEAMF